MTATTSFEDAQRTARAWRDTAVYTQRYIWKDVASRRAMRAIQAYANAARDTTQAFAGFGAALQGLATSLSGLGAAYGNAMREQADQQYEIARLSGLAGYNVTADLDRYAQELGADRRRAAMFASRNILAGWTLDGKERVFP